MTWLETLVRAPRLAPSSLGATPPQHGMTWAEWELAARFGWRQHARYGPHVHESIVSRILRQEWANGVDPSELAALGPPSRGEVDEALRRRSARLHRAR